MINGKKEILTAAGIQADEALERLMGSEALLERFLKKFLQDKSYEELVSAIEGQELERAFRAAHTLKGVCGNLSLNRLGDLVKEQVELLRVEGVVFRSNGCVDMEKCGWKVEV